MKRHASKKPQTREKGGSRKERRGAGHLPLEFGRGWQDLEAQHDRIKSDWMSLAAQLGIGSRRAGHDGNDEL